MFYVNELIHVYWFTEGFQLISRSHLQWKGIQFGGTLFKKNVTKTRVKVSPVHNDHTFS